MKHQLLAAGLLGALLVCAAPQTPAQAVNQSPTQEDVQLPVGGRVSGITQRIDDSVTAPKENESQLKAASSATLKFANGDSSYGYNDLKNHDKASAKRKLYQRIHKDAIAFENAGNTASKLSGRYYFSAINYVSYGLNYNDVYEVYKLFQMDHPSCYWMDISVNFLYNNTSCYLCVDDTFAKASKRKAADTLIQKKLKEYQSLTAGLDTKYAIEQAVHDKICKETTYNYVDLSNIYSQSIMGVMDSNVGTTVCAGYAKSFAFVLRTLGVDALYVEGYGNGEGHAWNLVQLDNGQWYWNDVTWDDTSKTVAYFNCPNTFFKKQHYANSSAFSGYDHSYDLPTAQNGSGYSYPAKATKTFPYNGHTYAYYASPTDWLSAEKACEAAGGTLAVLTDAEEHTAVTGKLTGKQFWLGGLHEAGGSWNWVSGEPWSYSNWTTGIGYVAKNATSYAYVNADGEWESYTNALLPGGMLCEWNTAQSWTTPPAMKAGYVAGFYDNQGKDIAKGKISALAAVTYDGIPVAPAKYTVTYGSTKLVEDVDYLVTYKNNVNAGTGTMVVYGIGDYQGKLTKTFQIKRQSLTAQGLKVGSIAAKTYTGSAITPNPKVTDDTWRLTKGTDYKLTYKNNKNVGTATTTVTGIGNYIGSVKRTFRIQPASLKSATVAKVYEQKYTGKAIKPSLTVKVDGITLKRGTDYTVSYQNNVKVGQCVMTIRGKGNYTATIHRSFQIVKRPATAVTLNKSTASLAKGNTLTLKATIRPSNASTKTLTWTSSKPSVAAVSSSGKVTAKKAGKTTITVRTASGKTAKCTITVS